MPADEHMRCRQARLVRAAAALAALLVVASVTFAVQALAPADLPIRSNPTVVELVFDSPGVVLAARVLLVLAALVLAVAGAFIVGSMIVRMRNGDWLKRIGPFEVSETAAADLAAQVAHWRSAALDRQRRLDDGSAALTADQIADDDLVREHG